MKKYYKEIDGKVVFYKEPLILNDMQIYNPSEKQILEAGWIEYIIPESKQPEWTDEELLQQAKDNKIEEINSYDNSSLVNSFIVGDLELWIPVEQRATLRSSIEAYQSLGIENVSKMWDGIEYTFTTEQWIEMINRVEVYASECFNTTQKHIRNVNNLTDIQEVQNYDYTTGYPDKLIFTL